MINNLELNTVKINMFIVERMRPNLLLPLFEPMVSILFFSVRLNELDVIKLKLPSEAKLKGQHLFSNLSWIKIK